MDSLDRRSFLKVMAASLALAGLGGCASPAPAPTDEKIVPYVRQPEEIVPGKPLFFGRSDTKTVFALPGNPVSTFLCFYKYIKPWIESGLGITQPVTRALLATDYSFKPDLTYFLQVKIDKSEGHLAATPDAGEGSGDFANLRSVDGFIELPPERSRLRPADTVE